MADPFTEANKAIQQSATVDSVRATVANREDLKTLKQSREIQLDQNTRANEAADRAQETFERNTPTPEQLQLQNEVLTQQLHQTQSSLDKNETFDAFDRYVADGDVKHLNNIMDNTRIKEGLYGEEVVAISKIDIVNDELLMQKQGLDPELFKGENAENANHRYVKIMNIDGSEEIVDMTKILAGTGYLNHVSKENLEIALDKANLKKKLGEGKGSNFSTIRNDIEALVEQGLSQEEAKEIIITAKKIGKPTAAQKNLIEAEKRESQALTEFGGSDEFFATDFSKRENLLRVNQDIEAIEKLKGIELSNAEKKNLKSIRSLIELAGKAGEKLTSKQTGLIDNFLLGTKKFVTDSTQGIEGAAAYETFKNTLLRSFGGTALTASEIKRLNKALGSLGNQLGPVLAQLKVSTEQIKQELLTIASTQNPTVAHVRLGATQEKVLDVISALEERIEFLNGMQSGENGDLEIINSDNPQTPSSPTSPGKQGQATNENITKPVDEIAPKLEDFNFFGGN